MTAIPRARLLTRGLRLEYLTVGWNLVEGLIAVGAGLAGASVALIGFGRRQLRGEHLWIGPQLAPSR